MKANKLFRKLALSGIALGTAAVTLTATTFAWYTANTTVTVESISGMTEAKAGGEDVYVSACQDYTLNKFGNWGPSATPVLSGGAASAHELKPVSYTNSSNSTTPDATGMKFVAIKSASKVATGESEVTYYQEGDSLGTNGTYVVKNTIYEYKLRFHAVTDDVKSFYFNEFNFTTGKYGTGDYTDPNNYVYSPVIASNYGAGTGITAAGEYFADLSKALKLTVVSQPLNGATADGGAAVGTPTKTTFDLSGLIDDSAAPHKDENMSVTKGTSDAVTYYNSVMGTKIKRPEQYVTEYSLTKKSGNTALDHNLAFATTPEKTGTVTNGGYVEVTFIFWLDGWDEYCYDCMKQQWFKFDFKASIDQSQSVIGTTTAITNS